MKYCGIILTQNKTERKFLKLFPDISGLHSKIYFHIYSYEEFAPETVADLHIAILEIPSPKSGDSWFLKTQKMMTQFPFLRILVVLDHTFSHNFYYLNRIPYCYLFPVSQAGFLLGTGLEKAVKELDAYAKSKLLKRSFLDSSYLDAVLLSTEELSQKGHKGCHIYFPDGRREYTRMSMKTILPKLPGNFIRVHKSYILNMVYYRDTVLKKRPSGKAMDEYILLSGTSFDHEMTIPVGPKYRNILLDFLMNKYAHPFLEDLEREETAKNE